MQSEESVKKTIYLLNIGDYAPELTALTYPHIEFYARKIGAEIHIIDARKFPEWDVSYEKLQIYELAKQRGDDWAIYIDSDALVHPDLPDITELLPLDTVAHNGADFAPIRWRYDHYFRRDGRNIGSCNWFAVASSWCLDLWKPLDDIRPEEALSNISLTVAERPVMKPAHLVDDYALSRNIARYGLKFKTLHQLWGEANLPGAEFFYHEYLIGIEEKINRVRDTIKRWNI